MQEKIFLKVTKLFNLKTFEGSVRTLPFFVWQRKIKQLYLLYKYIWVSMKRTLKLVGIFIVVFLATVAISLGGYILITQNQTYYIYNVEFVEPVKSGYIYTDDSSNYVAVHDRVVYLKSDEENYLRLAVLAVTSNNTKNISITSSDPKVANIVYKDGMCYAHYKKAGQTKITTNLEGVKDSFMLYVCNTTPSNFIVFDYAYYGNERVETNDGVYYRFADDYKNKIVCYADGQDQDFAYKVYDEFGVEDTVKLNQSAFEVAYYDNNLFNDISIDGQNKVLRVNCKSTNTTNSETYILVQSYYLSNGEKKIQDQYVINVRIVIYEAEFLQAVISTTPDFDDCYVLLNIANVTEQQAKLNPALVEGLLSVRRAKTTISNAGEVPTFVAYFTPKVSKLYLKFRLVYTNNDIVYLNSENQSQFEINIDSSYTDGSSETRFFRQDPTGEFYELVVDGGVCQISFTVNYENAQHILNSFTFEYVDLANENLDKFYVQNEDGTYSFIYFDIRTRYGSEIYDSSGNIVGFGE